MTLDQYIRDALNGDADRIAIEFGGKNLLWRDVKRMSSQLDALLSRYGVGAGQKVGLIPRTVPPFAAALLSLIASRRSIAMIYGFQSDDVIAADIHNLGLAAYIGAHDFWSEKTLEALPEGSIALALPEDLLDGTPVREIGGRTGPSHAKEVIAKAPYIELLTSGTSGPPKRQPTPFQAIYDGMIAGNVMDVAESLDLGRSAGLVQFPLSNISGIYSLLVYAGSRRPVRMLERFSVEGWLDFVQTHRPATVILPPAGVKMLLDADLPRTALEGVRYITMGMTSLDHRTWRAFEERFGVPILYSYGATEFVGAAAAMTEELHKQFGAAKFGSAGRPSGDNEIRIVCQDDPDQVLPPGVVGLIEVRIPFLGDRWVRTNDLGRIDGDGFLFVCGRADGAINRGGFKILPAPIESAIAQHPAVGAVSVVAVRDARLGEVPVAVVEVVAGHDQPGSGDLIALVRQALPSTHVPAGIYFVNALPSTQSMKLNIREITEMATIFHNNIKYYDK